jgi:tetratricopeptide (TPR) repeat protein
MRLKTIIAMLLACAATGYAQEHMADTLRSGIIAEDSKQDTRAAIQQYNAVLKQYAEARETAATALFRMAECYRKQGDRQRAIAAYQRVVNEFADQSKLAAESRAVLSKTYQVTPDRGREAGSQNDRAKFENLMNEQKRAVAENMAARARYRGTIEAEMDFVKKQISEQNPRTDAGKQAIEQMQLYIIRLQRDLAAFDAGIAAPASR